MIRPPRGDCDFISTKACWVQRKTAVRLMSTTVCHCSTVSSSSGIGGAPMPALLNRTSRRPNLLLDRREQRLDGGRIGGVGRHREGAVGAVAGGDAGRLEGVGAAAGEGDVEARLEERERGGAADAAAGAGDDGDFLHDEPFVRESVGSTSSRARLGDDRLGRGEAVGEGEPEAGVEDGREDQVSGVATIVKRCGPNTPTPRLTTASRTSQSADPDQRVDGERALVAPDRDAAEEERLGPAGLAPEDERGRVPERDRERAGEGQAQEQAELQARIGDARGRRFGRRLRVGQRLEERLERAAVEDAGEPEDEEGRRGVGDPSWSRREQALAGPRSRARRSRRASPPGPRRHAGWRS